MIEHRDDLPELPEGWMLVAWEQIGICQNGRAFPSKEYQASGVKLLRPGNLHESGKVIWTEENTRYLSEQWAVEFPSFIVGSEELVINLTAQSLKDEFLGRVCITEASECCLLNQRIARLTPIKVLPKYILWLFKSRLFRQFVDSLNTGSLIQHMFTSQIEKFSLPLAPLNEQRRIVTKIEALKARSQRVKEALEAIPPLLDQFRQSVLAAAFCGDLTADWRERNPDVTPVQKLLIKSHQENSSILPYTWDLATVGDVIDSLKYGTSQKCSYEVEGVPVLRIPNIGNGIIEPLDLKYADLPKKEFEELRLVPGDILMIRSNGSASLVGKSSVVRESEKDFAYAGYLIRLRLNQILIDSDYLNFCLSSHDLRLQIEIPAKSTSGVHNINSQEVKRLKIPVAPLEEQKEIVQRIKLLFKAAATITQQYQEAKAHLDQLDQSILAKAFRGELVPQDPNDEPASLLLERIRAELAKQQASTKTAKKSTGKSGERRRGKAKQQDVKSVQMELPGLE